jgi:uncharacterized protein YndB with AHSA1/START domain
LVCLTIIEYELSLPENTVIKRKGALDMKILAITVLTIVGIIGIAVFVGYLLPVQHTASRAEKINAPVSNIWSAITSIEKYSEWKPDVKHTEKSGAIWKEVNLSGEEVEYEILEEIPEQRLVTKIATKGLPYGGTWTFQLVKEGGVSTLTITENGEVYNPFFRFMSKYVFGHEATLTKYLEALKQRVEKS